MKGRIMVLTAAVLALAAGSAQATIVYRHGSDIWVMADNGANPHALVTASQTPGMDQGLDQPAVDPNGGTVVAFEGTTHANSDFFNDTCYSGYYYSCAITHYGFNATGVYTYSAGTITRISAPPKLCATPDGCTTLDINPVPVTGGPIYFDANDYSGRLSQGDFVASSHIYRMNLDGSARADYGTACDNAIFLDTVAPDWANPAQIAYNGCQDGSDYGLLTLGSGGTAGTVVGRTALASATFESLSFAPDGSSIVAYDNSYRSGVNDGGLYLFSPAGSGAPIRELLVSPTDNTDPSFPGALRFSSPHFVGAGTIVFAAQGNIWSIPASCNACSFPANATQLTTDGQDGAPAWTSATLGPAPAPPPPPHGGKGTLTAGHLQVSGQSASVRVSCVGAAGAKCAVLLVLGATETVRNGKVIAVSAAKHKTVVLGSVQLTLTAGHGATMRVSLNRLGKSLLKRFHTLHTLLVVADNGKAVAAARPTFRAAHH